MSPASSPIKCRSGLLQGGVSCHWSRRLVKDRMPPTSLGAETGIEQSEALHHSHIVGLVCSEMMRHEQQLRIVSLETRDCLASERLRTDRVNPPDNISARALGDPRQQ